MANALRLAGLKVIFLVLGFDYVLFACCLNIQEYLSPDEIRSIFNTPADSVPEYEIVEIFHEKNYYHTRRIRSTSTRLQLQAFGKNITLYLEPNDHVLFDKNTPVYGATKHASSPFGVKYTRLENVWSDGFHTYQDPDNQVAVTMHGKPEGHVNVDGMIGDNMVIKPLPSRVQKKFDHHFSPSMSGFKNQQKDWWFPDDPQVTHHVVYKPTINPTVEGIGNQQKDWWFPDDSQVNHHVAYKPTINPIVEGIGNQQKDWWFPDDSEVNHHVAYKPTINPIIEGIGSQQKDWWFPDESQVNHHVVYKPTMNPIIEGIGNLIGTGLAVWNDLFDFRRRNDRFKRAIFDTVYPQLLIVLDYETYKIHNQDVQELTKYTAAFWNGVDLRYRDITNPKVRFNIAGIVITQEKDAIPYIKYYKNDSNLIEDRKTLKAFGKYLHEEKRFSPEMFDIAVVVTGLNMCIMQSDVCNPASRGLGYNGGACKHDIGKADLSIAILEDSGGFNGIVTAAHELGHLLGAPHDGDDSLSYIGGPGAKSCSWDDGYLMTSTRRNSRGLHWSNCSIQAIQHFLNQEAYCLRNKPVLTKPLPKFLPGTLLSRDEQCNKTLNMIECKVTRGECGALWCVDPNGTSNCVLNGHPAEGSPCYNGGICLDGHCVAKEKELISVIYN